ncbi:uncharacterized protein [Eurosta solidaginis]|uniref:uncharacterized protein n=1 Tax=Eurosta solidaginis TaxID=178769 RepID=UPI0035307CCB
MTHKDELNKNAAQCEEQNDGTDASQCSDAFPPQPELHDELLINIFSYLPYTDLTQARLVCRRWMVCVACKRFSKKFCLCIKEDNVQDIWKQLQARGFTTETIYSHLIYMGTDADQHEALQSILQKIGSHISSLKLRTLYLSNSLYAYFPKLERLVLEDLHVFLSELPFQLNTFRNIKGIHFVDDAVRQGSSQAVLNACLRENSTARLEELSIRVYAEHADLFLSVLRDHADTLKNLHIVYFGSSEPNSIVEKWLATFAQLKKLQKVKIYSCNTLIFEGTLKCMGGMPLRYLEVDCLKPVNPNVFQLLESCSRTLEHLAFFNFYLPKHISIPRTISTCCQNLQNLILSYTRLLDEDELCNIASNLVQLQVLVLSYCKNVVTNKSLTTIFKHLTQLRVLDLSGNNEFDLAGLTGYAEQPYSIQRLRRLEKLNLKSCQQLSNDEFLDALKFPFLRCLSFGCGIYTDFGIKILVQQCPLLEELTITYCPTLGRSALFCIAKSLPRLRVLHLLHCAPVDKSVRMLLYNECPLLTDLEISEKRSSVKTYFHQ